MSNTALTRRKFLEVAGLVGAGVTLGGFGAACGHETVSPTTGQTTAGPKTGGALVIGIPGESSRLDGQISTSDADYAYNYQIYDKLVDYDENYQLVNYLADEVVSNSDGAIWTVRLKDGVTFHSGKPLTADDVVFSYKRIIDPDNPKLGAASLSMLRASGIRKVDDLTVEFHLETPNMIFREALAVVQNVILPVDFDPKKPVGTGPFVLDSWTPGRQGILSSNANYWGEGPYVDSLKILELSDSTARINALLGGSVHAITLLPIAQTKLVESNPNLRVLNNKCANWLPFVMAIDMKPFDDVRVRQAFRLIVDRPAIIEQALGGYGWLGNDMYSPFDPGYPSEVPQHEQDLEQAKSLLKAAGYGDGLDIELVTSEGVEGSAPAMAQVFSEQAKGAGVTVNVKKLDPNTFWGEDFMHRAFTQDIWFTHNYLEQTTLSSLATAPYWETHWKDAEWQKLADEAFRMVDEAKRNEIIAEMSIIEHERGGYIIHSFKNAIDAYSVSLGGIRPDKSGKPLGGYHWSHIYFA